MRIMAIPQPQRTAPTQSFQVDPHYTVGAGLPNPRCQEGDMSSRRTFIKQASLLVAGGYLTPWSELLIGAENAVADTASGKVRGVVIETINIFKGIPYGAPTSGKNRFMP